jgi:GH24 family phage-related lysozyme (muramidase)
MEKIIILSLLLVGCASSKQEETPEQIKVVNNKELFTSTQKYQIMCWVIKKSENYRADSYRCQAGKKTVGWGFTNISKIKDIHHADEIFRDIITPLYEEVNRSYPQLTYLQKAVIVSLYYNSGSLTKIKKSDFAKALVKNDTKKAVKNFKQWNKVKVRKGKFIVSRGLVIRRSYEAKLLDGSFNMSDYNKLKQEVTNIYKKSKS